MGLCRHIRSTFRVGRLSHGIHFLALWSGKPRCIAESSAPFLMRLFDTFAIGIALSAALALTRAISRYDSDHRRQAIALCILPRMLYTMVYATRGFHHPSLIMDARMICIFLIGFMFPTYPLVTGALNPYIAGVFFAIKSALMGSYYYCYPSKFFTPSALIPAEEEFIVRRGAMYTFISFVWIVTLQTCGMDVPTAIGASSLTWGLTCCHLVYAEEKCRVVNGLLIGSVLIAFAIAVIEFAEI